MADPRSVLGTIEEVTDLLSVTDVERSSSKMVFLVIFNQSPTTLDYHLPRSFALQLSQNPRDTRIVAMSCTR